MQLNKKTLALFGAGMLAVGSIASVGMQVFAQSSPASTPPVAITTQTQDIVDNAKDAQDENVALPAGGISEAQARAAITTQYPNITILHIKLEDNNGTIVYGAKLSDKTEVTVDATTGVVAQESADQGGIEHQDSGKSDTGGQETNGVETNDRPNGQNETGETGQN